MSDKKLPAVVGAGGSGGKGGARSGVTYAPSEKPDTLHSRSYVDVIYAIGEGPIREFVGGMGGIYVDGTPMLDDEGHPNFMGGANAWFRFGDASQEPIPHDSVAADEVPVDYELKKDAPWIVQITDETADTVVITMTYPQMASQDKKTMDVSGTKVQTQFFLSSNGGPYQAQAVGYGEIGGVRLSSSSIKAGSLAWDVIFSVVDKNSKYRKLKVYVGTTYENRTLYDANLELFPDREDSYAKSGGQINYAQGGEFIVWLEPNDGGGAGFEIEWFKFYGLTYVHEVEGKCLQPYQQQIKMPLKGDAPWDIKVVRLTPDSDSSSLVNSSFVSSYRTEVNTKLNYSYTALVGVRFPADAFQSIPDVKFKIRALLTSVPANYDPGTRTYAQMSPTQEWDGTWKFAWHSNPVWCVMDVVTHDRYGLGDFDIPVNKWELYQIAKYCDQPIPNGLGGTMPRFRCDISIDTREEAYNWVQTMCAIFRGMAYHLDGYFTATCDRPGDPEYLFNNTNVVNGEFNYPGSSLTARHTCAYVTWKDPDQLDEPVTTYVPDRELIARYGFNPLRVSAPWCRYEPYARQIGEWMLATEKAGYAIVFKPSTAEAAFLRPGMLIAIADEHRAGLRMGGRIVSSTETSVEIDQLVEIKKDVAYRIRLFNGLGDPVRRDVTTGHGYHSKIDFDPPMGAESAAVSVWILEAVSVLQSQLARIVEITEEDGGIGTVTAISHDEYIYDHIERDVPLKQRKTSVLSARSQAPPSNLKIDEELYVAPDQTIRNRVSLSWIAAPGALSYKVAWKVNKKPWVSGESSDTLFELQDASPGDYEFKVRAVNIRGLQSRVVRLEKKILGKVAPPPRVGVFRIVALRDGKRRAIFRYRKDMQPVDHRGYLIRYGRGAWDTWAGMTRLHTGVLTTSPFDFSLYGQGLYTFAIKAVDTSGNQSEVATFRRVNLPRAAIEGELLGSWSERDENWSGEITI